MITITDQINQAIIEAGGDIRLALDTALAEQAISDGLLETEQARSALLLDALEEIRAITLA